VNPLDYAAPAWIRDVIAGLGRTEDVKFSPDGRRLAIAGYTKARIVIVDVQVSGADEPPAVQLTGVTEIDSPDIIEPHGLSFLDPETLLVACRAAFVSVLKLPPAGHGARRIVAPAVRTLRGAILKRIQSPGSVAGRAIGNGLFEVLVCNNYRHRVTRHVLDGNARYRVRSNRTLLRRALDIPDGIDVSADGRWIAVSNHVTHSVLIYENSERLDRDTEPAGQLSGIVFPHGLRFTPDGRALLVAAAGSPHVHVGRRTGDSWAGLHPTTAIATLPEPAFLKGRHNPAEGGPKGLDIDGAARVVVTTSQYQPLAFFSLADMLAHRPGTEAPELAAPKPAALVT
jgi:hypothetical protein